jgi:glucosamine kinase
VARKMLDIELAYIDTYVQWFKRHGAQVMAIVGGFGQRLFPVLQERYGDFVALPQFEPLHGAVILARQNYSA